MNKPILLIAGHNAQSMWSKADIICDGVEDEKEFNLLPLISYPMAVQ